MKTALIYGLIAAVIAWFFMYLDTRLLDNPKHKTVYCKNMLLVGGIVGFGIHMIGEKHFEDAVGISDFGQGGSGSGGYGGYSDYSEEMLTGAPDF